jgi:hypothetical protein
MLKTALLHPPCPRRAETRPFPGFVLSRVSRCGVAQGYASLATLPTGSLDGYFEHPAMLTFLGDSSTGGALELKGKGRSPRPTEPCRLCVVSDGYPRLMEISS